MPPIGHQPSRIAKIKFRNLLPFVFAILFLLDDLFKEKIRLNPSFMAGCSIAYFFIVVLPEVLEFLPEYPLHLENLEFVFFLIGFSFIHFREKVILQRVERKNQVLRVDFTQKEANLESVEQNIAQFLTQELTQKQTDKEELYEIADTIQRLKNQEISMRQELTRLEEKKTIVYCVTSSSFACLLNFHIIY